MSRSPQRWSRSSIATGFIALALVASGAPAATSRVFVTSTTHTGDLKTEGAALCGGTCADGLAGGDAICNKRASDASLGGTWVAWLSTSSVDAKDRLPTGPGPGKYVRATGSMAVIADDDMDLLDFLPLDSPILLTETGATISPPRTWTGTFPDGSLWNASFACGAWADAAGFGLVGFSLSSASWTFDTSVLCSALSRLYCFEVPDLGPPAAVPAVAPGGLALMLLLSLAGLAFLYRRQSPA